jgi:hypothetical protein
MKIETISKTFLAAVILAAGGTALNAQTLLNGSFTAPSGTTIAQNGYEQTNPPADFTGDTDFGTSGGVIDSQFYSGFAAASAPYLFFATPGTADAQTGISQDLGALQANTTYTVSVYESTGGGDSYGQGASTFQLDLNSTIPTDGAGTPTITAQPTPSGNAVFTLESVSYTTGALVSGDLLLNLSAYDVGQVGDGIPADGGAPAQTSGQVFFEDASLASASTTPTTPEPSTWALMLLGLGGLAFGLRQRAVRNS